MEQSPRHSEGLHAPQELGLVRNKVQIALALMLCRDEHPELSEAEVRSRALKDWVGDPDDQGTFAAKFSEYIDAHKGERIDPDDEFALRALLEEVKRGDQTIH